MRRNRKKNFFFFFQMVYLIFLFKLWPIILNFYDKKSTYLYSYSEIRFVFLCFLDLDTFQNKQKSVQLTTTTHWPCYCTVRFYVVILFLWLFVIFLSGSRFFYLCLYLHCCWTSAIKNGRVDCYPIDWFNPAIKNERVDCYPIDQFNPAIKNGRVDCYPIDRFNPAIKNGRVECYPIDRLHPATCLCLDFQHQMSWHFLAQWF